jgi:hypothetical protein
MEDNEKAEMDVTGFGNPSLEADRIDDDTDAQIDDALDAAFSETGELGEAGEAGIPDEEPVLEPQEPPQEEPQIPTEPQTPAAEPAQTQEPTAPQVEIDPEISAIEQPRNLSEKNQSNWRKLQETASNYKRQAQEAEAMRSKLQEYETKPPLPSDYEDLRQFRAIFDVQSDPDFQKKYDEPINQAKTQIYSILKKHQASDELIQKIEAQGGPDKVNQEWWVNNVINKLPLTDAEKLKRGLVDVSDLQERRVAEVQKSASNAEQYYQQRGEAAVEWFSNQENEIFQYVQNKIVEQKADWAMRKEIPKNATADQVKAIQSHNEMAGNVENLFVSALWPKTSQERADVAAAAAMSHVLSNQLRAEQTTKQKMQQQLKQLTEENTRLKGAGKMPKQNLATASSNKQASTNDRLKMSSLDAIDLGLEEAGA